MLPSSSVSRSAERGRAMIAESDLKISCPHPRCWCDSYVDLYNSRKITGARKTLNAYKKSNIRSPWHDKSTNSSQ
jgi:hypothetical protein